MDSTICSTRARTLPSCVASTASNLESKDYSCFTLQFWWHSSVKMSPIVEYAQLYIKKKNKKPKRCVDFHKDVSHQACHKNMFQFFSTRTREICGCVGVPRNYSIFELKLC